MKGFGHSKAGSDLSEPEHPKGKAVDLTSITGPRPFHAQFGNTTRFHVAQRTWTFASLRCPFQ